MKGLLAMVSVAIGLQCVGCDGPGSSWEPIRSFDYALYVSTVEPVLAEGCASPSCHGDPIRPFALYGVMGWRDDPAAAFLPDPLTPAELNHNFLTSSVFADSGDTPNDALLLRKPLGDAGDTYHGGGVVFGAVTDAGYLTVLSWIEEGWTESE